MPLLRDTCLVESGAPSNGNLIVRKLLEVPIKSTLDDCYRLLMRENFSHSLEVLTDRIHRVYSCTFVCQSNMSSSHTVCVQIFAGLHFREFCKSTGDCENKNVKTCMHTVQVCCCRPPFAKLKLRKLLGAGHSLNIHPAKIVCLQYNLEAQ